MKPIIAHLGTWVHNISITQSQWATFTFDIGSEFEAQVPLRVVTPTNVSAGAEVYFYRELATPAWETEGHFIGAFPATGASTLIKAMNLETGKYLVNVLVGGGSAATWSVGMLTAVVITAYE